MGRYEKGGKRMFTSQPERPTRMNAHMYFSVPGLLTGTGLTFSGPLFLTGVKSDVVEANVYMGMAGLLLARIGLLPL
jgi:hypothetical protein